MPKLKSDIPLSEYFSVCVPVKISAVSLAMLDDVIKHRVDIEGHPLYIGHSSLIRVALIKFLNEELKKLEKRK